jgi:hypothetical protein
MGYQSRLRTNESRIIIYRVADGMICVARRLRCGMPDEPAVPLEARSWVPPPAVDRDRAP